MAGYKWRGCIGGMVVEGGGDGVTGGDVVEKGYHAIFSAVFLIWSVDLHGWKRPDTIN